MRYMTACRNKAYKSVLFHTSGISMGGAGDTHETLDHQRLLMKLIVVYVNRFEPVVWTQQSPSDGICFRMSTR
jgi:hypothetical protein